MAVISIVNLAGTTGLVMAMAGDRMKMEMGPLFVVRWLHGRNAQVGMPKHKT